MGRHSTFNEKDAAEIVGRLSQGEPMAQICRDEWLPTDRTVRNWMEADAAFASAIAHAREAGFDAIAADALLIADGKDEPSEAEKLRRAEASEIIVRDHNRDRLRVDTRLKLLAKWDPKRYGDKLAVGGDPDAPPIKAELTVRLV